jgi:hypothetical protein
MQLHHCVASQHVGKCRLGALKVVQRAVAARGGDLAQRVDLRAGVLERQLAREHSGHLVRLVHENFGQQHVVERAVRLGPLELVESLKRLVKVGKRRFVVLLVGVQLAGEQVHAAGELRRRVDRVGVGARNSERRLGLGDSTRRQQRLALGETHLDEQQLVVELLQLRAERAAQLNRFIVAARSTNRAGAARFETLSQKSTLLCSRPRNRFVNQRQLHTGAAAAAAAVAATACGGIVDSRQFTSFIDDQTHQLGSLCFAERIEKRCRVAQHASQRHCVTTLNVCINKTEESLLFQFRRVLLSCEKKKKKKKKKNVKTNERAVGDKRDWD